MNGYNLTDKQKELLRKLVRYIREGKLREPIAPVFTQQEGYFISLRGGGSLEHQGDLIGDLDALCDVDLMGFRYNERGNKLYNIKQAGYDAVDSDFTVPQPITSHTPLTGDDKIAVGIPEQLMLHFKRQISDSWRHKDSPLQIQESLARFRQEHPDPSKAAFIMMQFGETSAHTEIAEAIKDALRPHGIAGLRADDKQYHDDLFPNVMTYIYGCGFGIAVFERLEAEEFNPNVALEVGYMFGLRKPICLLKDKTLKTLHADLVGKLYKEFDPQNPTGTIPRVVSKWLSDWELI